MGKCNENILLNGKDSGKTTMEGEIWWRCNINNRKIFLIGVFYEREIPNWG